MASATWSFRGMGVTAPLVAMTVAVVGACGGPDPPQYGPPGSLFSIPPPLKVAGGGCTEATRLPIDAACTVKWSTDIFPKMAAGTPWNCAASGCHAAGGNDPVINDKRDETYENLAKKTTNGKPYFNPCSKDIAASSFACNTRATGQCASAMPPGNGIPEADKAIVNTWVACGSPKN